MTTTLPDADIRGFYAALGIELPGWAQREASVRCFAAPDAHARGDRDPSCSVNVETAVSRYLFARREETPSSCGDAPSGTEQPVDENGGFVRDVRGREEGDWMEFLAAGRTSVNLRPSKHILDVGLFPYAARFISVETRVRRQYVSPN
jgi:hypothetical protein